MKADLTRNTFHPSEAVADSAKPEWRETVRQRKQTFATGSGVVNENDVLRTSRNRSDAFPESANG